MEKELSALINKMGKYRDGHPWLKDIPKVIPKVGEVYTEFIEIGNIAYRIKLDNAWRCIANNVNIEQSINMIYDYVSDEERAFYISGEFRKIILSSSLIASSIIAYIMGRVVNENRKCTHAEILITNALTEMTDYDIENFLYLTKDCVEVIGEYETISIRNLAKQKKESCKYTMHILASHGIVDTESGIVDESSLYEGLHYVKTSLCEELVNYIFKVKQILDYGKEHCDNSVI